jgi:predicted nucleic acid-binding protein
LTTCVVDANVAVKWCVPGATETLVQPARRLLELHRRGELALLVPDLFWAELANVLCKAVRMGKSTRQGAITALKLVGELNLPSVSSAKLVSEALQIALRYDRTVYDSLYVALAVSAGSQLITADERLANSLAAYLPVKWLGVL